MFTYKNEITASVQAARIWELYADISQWPTWDATMDSVELQGAFISGTQGVMYMKGMPPLPFTLENVVEDVRFTVVSSINNINVSIDHLIVQNDAVLRLTHTVEISGGIEQQIQGMGYGISNSIPPSMEQLVSLAKGE